MRRLVLRTIGSFGKHYVAFVGEDECERVGKEVWDKQTDGV